MGFLKWRLGVAGAVVFWCLFLFYLMSSLEWSRTLIGMKDDPNLKGADLKLPGLKGDPAKLTADQRDVEMSTVAITGNIPVLLKKIVKVSTHSSNSKSKTARDVIQVLIAADLNSLGGLITVVHSIISNTKKPVYFYLVTTANAVNVLRTWIDNTKLRKIDYEVQIFNRTFGPGIHYAKTKILDLFPEIEGKLIVLDNDVAVLGDIWKLFKTPIRQGHLGAFSDDCSSVSKRFGLTVERYATHLNFQHPEIKNLRLNPSTCSFSAGVFVTNMTLWKQEGLSKQLDHWMTVSNKNTTIFGLHQGEDETEAAMLIVFYKRISPLDPLWNVRGLGLTTANRYSKQFLKKAQLLHWSGHYKPWGRQSPFVEVWNKYYIPDPTGHFKPVRKKG